MALYGYGAIILPALAGLGTDRQKAEASSDASLQPAGLVNPDEIEVAGLISKNPTPLLEGAGDLESRS